MNATFWPRGVDPVELLRFALFAKVLRGDSILPVLPLWFDCFNALRGEDTTDKREPLLFIWGEGDVYVPVLRGDDAVEEFHIPCRGRFNMFGRPLPPALLVRGDEALDEAKMPFKGGLNALGGMVRGEGALDMARMPFKGGLKPWGVCPLRGDDMLDVFRAPFRGGVDVPASPLLTPAFRGDEVFEAFKFPPEIFKFALFAALKFPVEELKLLFELLKLPFNVPILPRTGGLAV